MTGIEVLAEKYPSDRCRDKALPAGLFPDEADNRFVNQDAFEKQRIEINDQKEFLFIYSQPFLLFVVKMRSVDKKFS